jgi:hypothetical protein
MVTEIACLKYVTHEVVFNCYILFWISCIEFYQIPIETNRLAAGTCPCGYQAGRKTEMRIGWQADREVRR